MTDEEQKKIDDQQDPEEAQQDSTDGSTPQDPEEALQELSEQDTPGEAEKAEPEPILIPVKNHAGAYAEVYPDNIRLMRSRGFYPDPDWIAGMAVDDVKDLVRTKTLTAQDVQRAEQLRGQRKTMLEWLEKQLTPEGEA